MKELFQKHYNAIVERGLITNDTTINDFFEKLDEEVKELKNATTNKELISEAMDCMCVVANMLQHIGFDIEKELIKNIEVQEKRAYEFNK